MKVYELDSGVKKGDSYIDFKLVLLGIKVVPRHSRPYDEDVFFW